MAVAMTYNICLIVCPALLPNDPSQQTMTTDLLHFLLRVAFKHMIFLINLHSE